MAVVANKPVSVAENDHQPMHILVTDKCQRLASTQSKSDFFSAPVPWTYVVLLLVYRIDALMIL